MEVQEDLARAVADGGHAADRARGPRDHREKIDPRPDHQVGGHDDAKLDQGLEP